MFDLAEILQDIIKWFLKEDQAEWLENFWE